VTKEEKANRLAELVGRSKAICPGCDHGSMPVESSGSWFHIVDADGTYNLTASAAGMMQACAASSILAEMQLLKAELR
jgi:hypothetical protein